MKALILSAILTPFLAFGSVTAPYQITIKLHQIGEVEGLYLLEWCGTMWAPLEVLDYGANPKAKPSVSPYYRPCDCRYCLDTDEDGDVESNQVNESNYEGD